MRFVPRDLSNLEVMYRALCECQLLHPDPQDSLSEEEEEQNGDDEDGYRGDGEGDHDQPNDQNGANEEQMEVADGQFDDAI